MKWIKLLFVCISLVFIAACRNSLTESERNHLPNNAHPFAVILSEYITNSENQVDAFWVDVDGNETDGVVIVTQDIYRMPIGTLYYFSNNNIYSANLGMQDFGFVTATLAHNNRLVNLQGDGGSISQTLFTIYEGALRVEFTLRKESDNLIYPTYSFYLNLEQDLHLYRYTKGYPIPESEWKRIYEEHGFADIIHHWEMVKNQDGELRPVIPGTEYILHTTLTD